jgi:hypothetical protein
MHEFCAGRVHEFKAVSEEGWPTEAQRGAILRVAGKRHPSVCKLRPDLMETPGEELDLNDLKWRAPL